jgi:hypothetical protein
VLFAIERGLADTAGDFESLTALYALALMVWATGFVETWKRRQAALGAEWDVRGVLGGGGGGGSGGDDDEEGVGAAATVFAHGGADVASTLHAMRAVRPEFEGTFRRGVHAPSGRFVPIGSDELPADSEAPLLEMVPARLPRERMLCSTSIISCLLGCTLICSLGLLILRYVAGATAGTGGIFGAALLTAIYVEVSGHLYRRVAHRLTAWENHRCYEVHRDSLILKLCLFSFCNKFYGTGGI